MGAVTHTFCCLLNTPLLTRSWKTADVVGWTQKHHGDCAPPPLSLIRCHTNHTSVCQTERTGWLWTPWSCNFRWCGSLWWTCVSQALKEENGTEITKNKVTSSLFRNYSTLMICYSRCVLGDLAKAKITMCPLGIDFTSYYSGMLVLFAVTDVSRHIRLYDSFWFMAKYSAQLELHTGMLDFWVNNTWLSIYCRPVSTFICLGIMGADAPFCVWPYFYVHFMGLERVKEKQRWQIFVSSWVLLREQINKPTPVWSIVKIKKRSMI